MDPKHIEILSPPDFNELLIKCSTDRLLQDTELWVSTDLFLKRRWRSKITKLKELHEFVDEVQGQKFFKWTHTHSFVELDSSKIRITDEVVFQFGFGIIGRIIERIVLPRIERVFIYREQKIKEILERQEPVSL